MRRYPAYPVILALIISMLTNGLSLSFRGEVFAHELDHIRQSLSTDPAAHLELHRNNVFWDGIELDAATHLCLHAAGQYQPFYFIRIPMVPVLEGKEMLAVYTQLSFSEFLFELPYHPPRKF